METFQAHLGVKNTISMAMIIFFALVTCMFVFFFIKKMKEAIDFLSNIVFVTIPGFLLITAVITIYFMITFDFCNSIHSSIYEGNLPIYNKGVGRIMNCFDAVKY